MSVILAVDDSPSMRKMVSFTLTGAGYQVVEAVDGQDAYEKAMSQSFDLVLTDQNMPRLDGLGLTNKRVDTLRRLAAAVACGALPLHAEQGSERLQQALCQLPGIGDWSASYLALRGCGEPDELPVGDLGLRKAAIWGPDGISARALAEHGQRWRPWRSYAAVYLWQSYSHGPLSDGEPC